MGDEEFTKDELEMLGEESEESEEQETDEKEEQEDEAGKEGDEEQEGDEETEEETEEEEHRDKVQERIDKVVFEKKEAERRLDILKTLGPDEFYKVYPDEKPDSSDEKKDDTEAGPLSFARASRMEVKGGEFEGQTLGEVNKENPIAAVEMYLDWRDKEQKTIEKKAADDAKIWEEAKIETDDFRVSLAKELFGKDRADLEEQEATKIEEVLEGIGDWMDKTDRFNYKLEDAYLLLNKDSIIAAAKGDGVKAMLKQLKEGDSKTVIPNKGSPGAKTGYEAFENLSADQLSGEIEGMTEKQYSNFIKDAPNSIKMKFPDIDWD